MKKVISAICIVAVIAFSTFASAENSKELKDLKFGSAAPKFEVKKFIKGDAVKKLDKGKIYVVEMWATWCPPCVALIPHVSELQEKFKDVTFIGVAVLQEEEEEVVKFVEMMGEKMEYRVALDLVADGDNPDEGSMFKNWLNPTGQGRIPTAFIVNADNKIAWIGYPAEMDEPLAQIVAGKWDIAAEAKKFDEAQAQKMRLAELSGKIQKLYVEFNSDGDPGNILAALDAAEKELPDKAHSFRMVRFQVLSMSKGRADDAIKTINELLEGEKAEDAALLNNLAWMIVSPDRDSKAEPKLLKLALKLALKADKLTENEDLTVIDTLAKCYFDNGDFAQAVKTQTRVVELADGTPYAEDPGPKRRLSQYKRALAKANSKPGDEK